MIYSNYKVFFVFLFGLLISYNSLCQAPNIEWQKTYGGSEDDGGASIIPTSDGNFVAIGYSRSNDGDITFHHSSATIADLWLVKIDSIGNIIWNRSLGGSSGEEGFSILQTFDEGFILLGYASSTDYDVSGLHGSRDDAWVVKTDSIGQIEWQRCFGTSQTDRGYQIKETPDSGFIFLAKVSGNDGDVNDLHNYDDLWVVKINRLGLIRWRKCLGGGNYDTPGSIITMDDGGYLVSGSILSTDGDITCTDPSHNVWIVKLDSTGNILWDRCYGGSNSEMVIDLLKLAGNGFYIAASTASSDGDVGNLIGQYNYWIIKCDSMGDIVWEKCFGGSQVDFVSSISPTLDYGLIISGWSTSPIAGNHGLKDAYIIKIDSLGNLEWEKSLGGSLNDEGKSILQTPDSNFILVGVTESNDGDVSSNHGSKDLWVVKLSNSPVAVNEIDKTLTNLQVISNENGYTVFFEINGDQKLNIDLYNVLGEKVMSNEFYCRNGENTFNLPTNNFNGTAILHLYSKKLNIYKNVISIR